MTICIPERHWRGSKFPLLSNSVTPNPSIRTNPINSITLQIVRKAGDLQKGWTEGTLRFPGSITEQLMMPAEASCYQCVYLTGS